MLNALKSAKEAEAVARDCEKAGKATCGRAIVAMGDVSDDAACRKIAGAALS